MPKSSKLRLLTAVAFFSVIFVIGLFRFLYVQNGFPYSKSNSDVAIELHDSSDPESLRLVYDIKKEDIDGRAVLSTVESESSGQSIINSQLFGIRSTFESNTAPYPGFITQVIACETKKYIKEQTVSFNGKETKIILAVVSGRRLFGICSLEEIKFASLFWAGYDEKRKQVVTVELFRPVTDLLTIAASQEEMLQVFKKVISTTDS